MVETWRAAGYDGYEVSDQGRVRSYWRQSGRLDAEPHILKPQPLRRGHLMLTLRGRHHVYVHHLVAEAFIGPRPPGYEVCHANSDPGDNRLGNLRYDTPKGNAADRIPNGTHTAGEGNGNAKLTADAVRAMRSGVVGDTRPREVIARELSALHGVTPVAIQAALRGRTWSALADAPAPWVT